MPVKIQKDKAPAVIDWYEEGRRLKRKGQLGKAIRALNMAIDHKIKFAEAYFERGICFYRLGNNRQASNDLAAAALLGCEAAEFWTRYDRNRFKKTADDNES